MFFTGGRNIPGEDTDWDLGTGAGFYVDATQEPWKGAYNMYTYVTEELPQTLASQFSKLDLSRAGITGFSMGGHGALTLVSAFSGIREEIVTLNSFVQTAWSLFLSHGAVSSAD